METVLALIIGALYATGFYLMVRRSVVKMVFGLVLLSHAANLLIFSMGGLVRESPPLLQEGATRLVPPYADPLPQALILTAIVIGFGLQAFALVLIGRAFRIIGSDDSEEMTTSDR